MKYTSSQALKKYSSSKKKPEIKDRSFSDFVIGFFPDNKYVQKVCKLRNNNNGIYFAFDEIYRINHPSSILPANPDKGVKDFIYRKRSLIYSESLSFFNSLLTNLPRSVVTVFNSILALKLADVNGHVVPAQLTIATHCGLDIKTVNVAMAKLHELGLILKKGRGWKDKNILNTCEYFFGETLLAKTKKAIKFINQKHYLWIRLYKRIPSLRRLVKHLTLVIGINLKINNLYVDLLYRKSIKNRENKEKAPSRYEYIMNKRKEEEISSKNFTITEKDGESHTSSLSILFKKRRTQKGNEIKYLAMNEANPSVPIWNNRDKKYKIEGKIIVAAGISDSVASLPQGSLEGSSNLQLNKRNTEFSTNAPERCQSSAETKLKAFPNMGKFKIENGYIVYASQSE